MVLHASYCRRALRRLDAYDDLGEGECGSGIRTPLRRDPGLLEGTTVGNDEIDLSCNDVLDDYRDIER